MIRQKKTWAARLAPAWLLVRALGCVPPTEQAEGGAPHPTAPTSHLAKDAPGPAHASSSPSAAPELGLWASSTRGGPPEAPAPAAPLPPKSAPTVTWEALQHRAPRAFGEHLPGVMTTFATRGDALAITIDLCDGRGAFDDELFALLEAEHIPATVFVTGLWATKNPSRLRALASAEHLEIQNHGARHRPCTANGRSQFGLRGTLGLDGIRAEVREGARQIEDVTGAATRLYRSGTAHFDDVCIDALAHLEHQPVGYSVGVDAGAALGRRAVAARMISAPSGSILLLHGHKPSGETFEGLSDALGRLRKRGVSFVKLGEVTLLPSGTFPTETEAARESK